MHLGDSKGMKRTVLSVILTLALLLMPTGLLVVNEVKANPFFIFDGVDPIPGTIPPIITAFSPENNTIYNSSTLCLSFNVSKLEPPTSLDSGITFVRYTLDGNLTGLYYCTHYTSDYPPGLPYFVHSKNLTLPIGKHTLVIEVGGVVLPGNMTIFGMSSSSTIFFTVSTNLTSEQTIPEFSSLTILPLSMTVILVAIVVKKRCLCTKP